MAAVRTALASSLPSCPSVQCSGRANVKEFFRKIDLIFPLNHPVSALLPLDFPVLPQPAVLLCLASAPCCSWPYFSLFTDSPPTLHLHGCVAGHSCSCMVDHLVLAHMRAQTETGSPLIKRRTALGGLFSILFTILAVIVIIFLIHRSVVDQFRVETVRVSLPFPGVSYAGCVSASSCVRVCVLEAACVFVVWRPCGTCVRRAVGASLPSAAPLVLSRSSMLQAPRLHG